MLSRMASGMKSSKQAPGSKSKHSKHHAGGGGKEKNFLNLSIPGTIRCFFQESPANQRLEEELDRLTNKIDNLLNRMEGQELEMAHSQEEECLVCGSNKATMQTLPCAHKVVCRQCFVRTIQMAVAQKRLPLRCILCRAKVLRLNQEGADKAEAGAAAAALAASGGGSANILPKSVSGYNIESNNISSSGSNYSFVSGISAVSSESCSSRKCSLARDFSFSSLSNFQNVNLLNKSQIPRSKSGSFSSRRSRRSRSPSPGGPSRSRSMEPVPPRIRVDRTPSDENIVGSVSPVSPCSPGLQPTRFTVLNGGGGPRSPRSPTSPTSPCSPGSDGGGGGGERLFSNSRGSSRLSTPLSPIKESRKEMMGSLQELSASPVHQTNLLTLQDPPSAAKPSSRIRCAEKIVKQLERSASSKQQIVVALQPEKPAVTKQPERSAVIKQTAVGVPNGERLVSTASTKENMGEEFREGVLINLSDDDDSPFPDQTKGLNNQHNPPVYPAAGRRPSLHTNNQRVKQSKSVSFKDC